MSERDDGGPAFPVAETSISAPEIGMTLRDYFAAQAISRSIEVCAQFVMDAPGFQPGERKLSEIRDRAATLAFSIADAMLAERAK